MRGTTLIELIVVLTILGLLTGIGVLAVGSRRAPREGAQATVLRKARAEAVRSGRAVSVPASVEEPVRFLPDGRAIGPGLDPLTGEIEYAEE